MNERIKKVTTVIKDKWSGFSTAVKAMVIAIPVAVIAIIIVLAILLNHKNDAVLFSGLTNQEASEIAAAISDMGIEDVRLRGDEIIVPEDQVDTLRMKLSVMGYPKDSSNYDIWNDGIDLWSTASDKQEVARQQREARIASTLRQLQAVKYATVILSVPTTKDYAITPEKEQPSCSVTLELVAGEELTNAEVRAIFALVSTSVENLTYDNISVMDTSGRSYEWISKEQEEAEGKDASGIPIARKRWAFQRDMENALMQQLKPFLEKIYGANGYAVNVAAQLNYDSRSVVDTQYQPVDGDNTGVLHHDKHIESNVGLLDGAGLPGVTPNADLSPDYPTLNGVDDGEQYYYNYDESEYDVSNTITKIEKDGYDIEKLTVGVAINTAEMTEANREAIALTVARAVGTDAASVSVLATPFVLPNSGSGGSGSGGSVIIPTRPPDPFRNTLLFLVIALGIILVALLIVSLFMSKNRKKKIRRRQEMALAAAQAAAADQGSVAWNDGEAPKEVDFNIASLTEEAGKDSRETILKREIAEFAHTNPEIVASIISNMIREEQ